MNILHVNTTDRGGAANACLRIHKSLLDKEVDSNVLLSYSTKKNGKNVHVFKYWDNTPDRLTAIKKAFNYYFKDRDARHQEVSLPPHPELFTFPRTMYDITDSPYYKAADIIQLNWVAGFLDEPSFFKKNSKPVIWRMADLYLCYGGYHYEKGFPFDRFRKYIDTNLKIRKKALENANLHIVPISNWTKQKTQEVDFLKDFPMTTIQCGFETDIFKPYDKELVQKLFGFPNDKKIVLFGADSLNSYRKGVSLLIEAFNILDTSDLFFCSFGGNSIFNTNHNIQSLGEIYDAKLLAMLYSAVDLFITPSIEETFGQVLIEAIGCGTPVVSFPTGGGLEVINEAKNGFMAKEFTSEALAEAIQKTINTPFSRDHIRKDAVNRFNINDKADEYIALYNKILSK